MKKIKYFIAVFALFFCFSIDTNAASRPLKDGTYTIYSALSNEYVVDLSGGTVKNKQNIRLYKTNDTPAQQWKVRYVGNGYYKIVSTKAVNYGLDVTGAKKKNGTNVQLYQYKGVPAQQWMLKDAGGGYYYIVAKCNGLYLDVKGGKVANRTNIQMYKGNKTKAQKFAFAPVETGTKTIEDGEYIISSALNSNIVVDLYNGKTINKQNIQMHKYNATPAEHWKVTYLNNGTYKIASMKDSNYVLDVTGGGKVKNTNIQLYKSNGTKNQQFIIRSVGKGYYNIISKTNGLVLDVKGGKTTNGTNLQNYINNGTNAQKFKFEKVTKLKTPEVSYEWQGGNVNQSAYKLSMKTDDNVDGYEINSYDTNNKYGIKTITNSTYDVNIENGVSYHAEVRSYKIVKGVKIYSNYSKRIDIDNFYGIAVESKVESIYAYVEKDNKFTFTFDGGFTSFIGENTDYYIDVYSYNDEENDYVFEKTIENKLQYDFEIANSDLESDNYPKYKFAIRMYNHDTNETKYTELSEAVDIKNNLNLSIPTLKTEFVGASLENGTSYKLSVENEQEDMDGSVVYVSDYPDEGYVLLESLENVIIPEGTSKYFKAYNYVEKDGVVYYSYSYMCVLPEQESSPVEELTPSVDVIPYEENTYKFLLKDSEIESIEENGYTFSKMKIYKESEEESPIYFAETDKREYSINEEIVDQTYYVSILFTKEGHEEESCLSNMIQLILIPSTPTPRVTQNKVDTSTTTYTIYRGDAGLFNLYEVDKTGTTEKQLVAANQEDLYTLTLENNTTKYYGIRSINSFYGINYYSMMSDAIELPNPDGEYDNQKYVEEELFMSKIYDEVTEEGEDVFTHHLVIPKVLDGYTVKIYTATKQGEDYNYSEDSLIQTVNSNESYTYEYSLNSGEKKIFAIVLCESSSQRTSNSYFEVE